MELAEDRIQCLYLALSLSNLWDLAQENKLSSSVSHDNQHTRSTWKCSSEDKESSVCCQRISSQ